MIDVTLDLALGFLKAHPTWYIFPITRLEKAPPHIDDNLALASNDPKQIKIWHTKWRGCNWGLSLRKSNVIVVDVDTKPGKVGQSTLDDLALEYGELPDTLTVRSPSGGLHFYFEGAHRFALGKYGFGLDIDSPNYVLIPGCWLCSNSERGYEIINDAPVVAAPAWFGEFLKEKAERPAAESDPAVDWDKEPNVARMIRYLQEGAPDCIQGQNGEKVLFDVACVLKDNGISEQNAVELLDRYYNVIGKCEPLWAIGEGAEADRLDVKVRNAYNYARENQAGSATADFAFGGDDAITDADLDEVKALRAHWQELMPKLEAARNKLDTKDDVPLDEPLPPIVDDSDFLDPAEAAAPVLDDEPPDEDPPPKGAPPPPGDSSGGEDAPPKGSKADRKTKGDVLAEWVWIVGLERFVRIADSKMWKPKQFDSRFNHFSKTASISNEIFKTSGLIRRFDDAISRPGAPMIITPNFNLWRPSPIVAAQGNTDLWDEHLNYLFQNPEDKGHVLNWMAWVYQNQTRKPNHALLIVGKNTGTGKSFIARIFEQLIGTSNTQRPKNSSLKGDFNGWALRCKLVIIEELMQIGRREVANELRDMITEPTVEVNIKNVPAQLVENYMAMMGISNHPDALPIDETDRRWLVVSTLVSRLGPDYYRRLFAILESPAALAAIAYQLQTRALGEYDASQAAPDTAAKQEMIRLSRSDVESWLYENSGNWPMSRNIVTIQDIRDAMPLAHQRVARLDTLIQTFIADKVRADPLGQIRLSDGVRVRLWALHGKGPLIAKNNSPDQIAALYEAERKQQGARPQDEQAMDDFGDA